MIERAAREVQAAVAQPDFVRGLAEIGITAKSSTPQELAERLRVETQQWRGYVRELGFTAES